MKFTLNMATNSDKAFEINDRELSITEVIVGQPEISPRPFEPCHIRKLFRRKNIYSPRKYRFTPTLNHLEALSHPKCV